MIKIYDTASNAFIEKVPKIYDETAGAWIEAPSVKTFDEDQNAWIERLYQGYFSLQARQVASADSLQVNSNEITLFTDQSAEERRIFLMLPFVWNNDTVEFDLVTNGVASVNFGKAFYVASGKSVSGYNEMITESYNGKVTISLGTTPDEYEGSPVTSSEIYIHISVSAESAVNKMGYVNLSNLKISGKKYGFKE